MSGHKPFIAEIVADPSDLDARRIYADWLVENGNELGEFIQLFFELDGKLTQRRRADVRRRIRELVNVYGNDAITAIKYLRKPEYRYGFIEHATISIMNFIKHGKQICSKLPLRSLELTAGAKRIPELIACEHLRLIEAIDFHGNHFGDRAFSDFPACKNLLRLKQLTLRGSDLAFQTAKAFGDNQNLPPLEKLKLSNLPNWDDDCSRLLFESRTLGRLQHLVVESTRRVMNETPRLIAETSLRASLVSLNLFGSSFQRGLNSMVETDAVWPRLESLRANYAFASNRFMFAMTKGDGHQKFPVLTDLRLNGSEMKNAALIALAESPLLNQLEELRISSGKFSMKGLLALANSEFRNPKTKFDFRQNKFWKRSEARLKVEFGSCAKF